MQLASESVHRLYLLFLLGARAGGNSYGLDSQFTLFFFFFLFAPSLARSSVRPSVRPLRTSDCAAAGARKGEREREDGTTRGAHSRARETNSIKVLTLNTVLDTKFNTAFGPMQFY